MSGYTTYKQWQRIEAHADMLGFRISNPKHGHWGSNEGRDQVAICPKDTELPTFTRDAEVFVGTFREVEIFLMGWERAQQYDMMLRLSDKKKRKTAEDKERERQRIVAEKLEQKKVWGILKGEQQLNPI